MKTKFLLLLAASFCVILTLNAQINSGRYLTGGSFNINNVKYNEPSPQSKNESYNVNIQFGKVIKANTVFGIILSYSYSDYHIINLPDSNFSKSSQYNAGVFYRKYKRLAKDFYFFGEVDAVYFHSDNSQESSFQNASNGSKSSSDGGSASFIPGISYALCKRMQLELLMPNIIGLSYAHQKTNFNTTTPPASPDQESNAFSFNTNLNANLLSNFGIGFKFLLGK